MNNRIGNWIRRYPIASFIIVAIVIMFALLFPVVYLIPQKTMFGQILGFLLARVGVFSPVLAAMFVSRITNPQRQPVPWSRRLAIFLPVWVIAVIMQVATLKLTAPPSATLFGLTIISLPVALLPAWVIASAFSGSEGVKQLLATLVRPKGSIVYYLVALLVFPFIHIVGTSIRNVMNGHAWLLHLSQLSNLAPTLFITFFSVLFFSGGINEESGWRGFAQKRLQAKYSPLVATIILWVMMTVWHIPGDIVQYRHGGYLLVKIGLFPFFAILFNWVYNRTKGSILAPAIFHASMNSMNPMMGIFPITTAGNIILIILAVIAIISDRMWRRLPADHPAVYQSGANQRDEPA